MILDNGEAREYQFEVKVLDINTPGNFSANTFSIDRIGLPEGHLVSYVDGPARSSGVRYIWSGGEVKADVARGTAQQIEAAFTDRKSSAVSARESGLGVGRTFVFVVLVLAAIVVSISLIIYFRQRLEAK